MHDTIDTADTSSATEGDGPPGVGSLESLRQRVLNTALGMTAIAAPAVSALICARAVREGQVNAILIVMSLYTLSFPSLYLARRKLDHRLAGASYLALMWVMSTAVALRGGATAGAAALQLVVVVLSGLLFGTRGVWLALLANTLGFVAAGIAVVSGAVPPVVTSMWDPNRADVWARSAVILALFGGAAALAVSFTTERLQRAARDARQALEREQAQHLALAQAEREKTEAREALAAAQRVEALGRMAGGVAHDFNNLLTVVLGASETARAHPGLPESVDAALQDIMQAALQGAELTRSLLLLGRRDLSRPRDIDAGELLRRLTGPMRRMLPSDVVLHVETGIALHVHIDPAQLERVLFNLVANARDAVADQGRIEIVCERRELGAGECDLAAGPYIAIAVRDNGSGIDAQTRARIFEPFFTTKAMGHGSGIGMALVQGFVSSASGTVLIDSEPGRGTEVVLLLPEAQSVAGAPPQAKTSAPPVLAPTGQQTILVVEDMPAVLSNTTRILRGAGYRVRQAADGDRALALVRDTAVALDVLCIDGVIPGASTAEVIAETRRVRPACRIVLCTGYVDEELMRRGIQLGELASVRKPYTSSGLLAAIATELSAARSRAKRATG